ncbi:MAG TPA: hypothetical protein VGM50_22875 [Gemmatimonadaceae bacterium]
MKNKLTDLNDHLFAQLERLSNENLSAEALVTEVQRATAVVSVADTIVANAKVQLEGAKVLIEWGDQANGKLPMLGSGPTLERVS